jgi:hypothetical protein
MTDHVQQIIREPGFFQHHAHEDKQWNGKPLVIGHHTEYSRRQKIEESQAESQRTKDKSRRGQRDAHRHAHHEQDEKCHQHKDGQPFDAAHDASLPKLESCSQASMAAARL